ncbi:MAG: hypothetical protein QXG12_08285 [Thermoproteota archaeon]
MPSREVHEYIDKILIGRSFPLIHRYKDSAWRYLGAKHRRKHHFNHLENILISCLLYGCNVNAWISAELHDLFDKDKLLSLIAKQYYKH